MNRIERGDVLLVNLEPSLDSRQQGKSRPCLVVSPKELNEVLQGVIICPLTDAGQVKQSELGLTFLPAGEGGLHKDRLVIAFQLRMIEKRRIIRRLGSIRKTFMDEVDESLKAVLDLT